MTELACIQIFIKTDIANEHFLTPNKIDGGHLNNKKHKLHVFVM